MSAVREDLEDLHWMMDMLQSIDVGLVVIDRKYKVRMWNRFMQNHVSDCPSHIIGKNLFGLFKDLPAEWLKRKTESVFQLKNRAFITWEQRPYLFKFNTYRPITGMAEFMYQNITFIPLQSVIGEINHVGIIIYDVTDIAIGKQALEGANRQLQGVSRTDALTQLYNRGYWEECLRREFLRVRRTKEKCSLLLFDIDHFKQVNDSYGHQTGDEVIRVTSATLTDAIRATDIAGRYGGEEFGVILVDTPAKNALVLAERLRRRIEARTVEYQGHRVNFTISLGISEIGNELESHEQWIQQSDQALYAAKENGRNQAIIFDADTI
jgi:diguanylate cyclase